MRMIQFTGGKYIINEALKDSYYKIIREYFKASDKDDRKVLDVGRLFDLFKIPLKF